LKTPILPPREQQLIEKRLREKYGFAVTSREIQAITRMNAKVSHHPQPRTPNPVSLDSNKPLN